MNVINLLELTDSQIEAAIQVGEGLTEDVVILEHNADPIVIKSLAVVDHDGIVRNLPTEVKFFVKLEDKINGDVDAVAFIEMTALGLIGKF